MPRRISCTGGVPHGIDNTQEFGAPGLTNGKEAVRPSNTMSSCATAVKVGQQVVGKHAGKLGMSGNGEPTRESTSIFVGVIPMGAVTDEQLQVMLGAKAKIKRYHAKAKVAHAKIQIPNMLIEF